MADTVGNLLGPRATFNYVTDSSINFNVTLDRSVALAVGNTLSENPAFPVLRATAKRPLELRYFLLQLKSNPTIRKKAFCCDYTNTRFLSSVAQDVTINGVVWTIVGRVGEKRSTLVIDEVPPA